MEETAVNTKPLMSGTRERMNEKTAFLNSCVHKPTEMRGRERD